MSMSADHKPRTLARSLGIGTLLAIAVSSISPTTSVFVNFGSMLQTVGTGMTLAFLIGGAIAILNSLIYAELGTAFPLAGGAYAIVMRVFGRPLGLITAFLYLLLGLGSVPALALGTASYLNVLLPGVPSTVFVVGVIVVSTLIAVLRIHSASWVTAIMVILEFAIIIGVTVLSLFHAIHPLSLAFSSHAVTNKGVGMPLGTAVLFSSLGITLFSFSGYELSQNFSEETVNVRRVLSRTIIISAIIAVVVETLAILALTLATKNFGAVVGANMPAYDIIKALLGQTAATVLLVGVIIAIFDCTIAVNMSYIRVLYNASRDGMFTPRLSRWLAHVSDRTDVPIRAAVVWGVIVLVVSVLGTLSSALAFTGVVLVLVYALVALAALFARKKFPERIAFKMPLWPLPSLILLATLIYVLTQQDVKFLELTGAVIVLTGLYYLFVVRRYWKNEKMVDIPDDSVEAGAITTGS